MKYITLALALTFGLIITSQAQTRLNISIPVLDVPQNFDLPHNYPSMRQALSWSNGSYELGFFGLDALGKSLFSSAAPGWKQQTFFYASGLLFSKYGSELPIPLGVWSHEEYHRATLGAAGIRSKNGNWLLHRWDGTVYGPTDEELADLKSTDLNQLLYSYVAGVQYETQLTKENIVADFYEKRTFYKNPLYLYNAFYVWNYFRFATSRASDSVKVIAPEHEHAEASQRDFAGADLTAWAYDMFSPEASYYDRDDFPNGHGKNRRIGFHDLPESSQKYLKRQKNLALLNFFNPSIFLINRIRINDELTVLPFLQYQPTYFGNDISVNVPFIYRENGYYLGIHQFNNHTHHYFGVDLGIQGIESQQVKSLNISVILKIWKQPDSFFGTDASWGSAVQIKSAYALTDQLHLTLDVTGKTAGWLEGNPYLMRNLNPAFGLQYRLSAMDVSLDN